MRRVQTRHCHRQADSPFQLGAKSSQLDLDLHGDGDERDRGNRHTARHEDTPVIEPSTPHPIRALATVLTALLTVAILAGCTPPTAEPPLTPGAGTPAAVRTDREPLLKRFPALANFAQAHWRGDAAGSHPGGLPGPTDVRIQAVVVLRPETLTVTKQLYSWQPAPPGWDAILKPELRPFTPANGDWQHNQHYEDNVCTARYAGTVYLETITGTVFLDVIST